MFLICIKSKCKSVKQRSSDFQEFQVPVVHMGWFIGGSPKSTSKLDMTDCSNKVCGVPVCDRGHTVCLLNIGRVYHLKSIKNICYRSRTKKSFRWNRSTQTYQIIGLAILRVLYSIVFERKFELNT